jgi:hypothetical protein
MSPFVSLLRHNANYRNTWIGQVISDIGDHFNNIAVFGLVLAHTGSGMVVARVSGRRQRYAVRLHVGFFLQFAFVPGVGVLYLAPRVAGPRLSRRPPRAHRGRSSTALARVLPSSIRTSGGERLFGQTDSRPARVAVSGLAFASGCDSCSQ